MHCKNNCMQLCNDNHKYPCGICLAPKIWLLMKCYQLGCSHYVTTPWHCYSEVLCEEATRFFQLLLGAPDLQTSCRRPREAMFCDRAPSHMGQRQSIVVPSPVVEQILASPSPKKGLRISHKHKYVGISPSFLHLTIQLAAGQGHRPLYYAGLAPSRNTSEERCKATESPMSPPAAGVFLVASPPEQ